MVKDAVARGGVELMKDMATPFVTIVIADLLGVPQDDRKIFMDAIENGPPPGSMNPDDIESGNHPLVVMGTYFLQYVTDRRETPREDILSELSNATYPDGTLPDALEIVRLATFLFGAGQDTSAKLLGNAIRFIVDEPGLQDRLRADPALIPPFIEEVLRLEGSVKVTGRLARRDTRIGDLALPAGTKVMLALSAGNRDPGRWENPEALVMDRPKIKEHLALSRGAHVCAGAPLARAEVRVLLEKLLRHTSHIDLADDKHGKPGARELDYEPSFLIRGLAELHVKLTPAADFVPNVPLEMPASAKPKKHGLLSRLFGSRNEEPAAGPTRYSTYDTKLGVLLADPAARATLDRHFPGMTADKRIGMGKGMTLRTVQKVAPDFFTTEALDAADADLAKLPVE
jgi:cytochrome P450